MAGNMTPGVLPEQNIKSRAKKSFTRAGLLLPQAMKQEPAKGGDRDNCHW